MTAPSIPRIQRLAQNTQYTYNLNRRIHDVKTYPLPSPQGATILIYGHENGLTIAWRGGRRLKAPTDESQPAGKDKRNGASNDDAVMIIDSDDEAPVAPTSAKPVANAEFEDAEAEDDNGHPEIVQELDLGLGTAATHIAVPSRESIRSPGVQGLKDTQIFEDHMVFAVTCATTDVFVITLPLTPPSHQSKTRPALQTDLLAGYAGRGQWGETMIQLGGQGKPSDGVAMSIVEPKHVHRSDETEFREHPNAPPLKTRVIVAASSREASGMLRFWDVALGRSDTPLKPFQTEYLPSHLTSIAFNPTRTTQLLATASPHAVRTYDYSIPSLPPHPDNASDGPFPPKGSWLLSLYPPFTRGSSAMTMRKPIVDAAWISHGRAILTLLADGQWGIWDINGGAPSSWGGAGLFGKAASGVRGTAITTFNVSGYLEGTSPLRNPGSKTSASAPGGEFVPMTPHTRREASMSSRTEMLASVHGGIEVIQVPSSDFDVSDESAVIWMGGADHIVLVIPRISRFWEAQVKRSAGGGVNLFSGAQPSRMIRMNDLAAGLLGERCCGVGAVVRPANPFRRASPPNVDYYETQSPDHGLPIDVVVHGESRVVFVRESEDGPSTTRIFGARRRKIGATTEPPSAIIVQGSDRQTGVPLSLAASRNNSLRVSRAVKDDAPTQVTVETLFKKPASRPSILSQSFRNREQAEQQARQRSAFEDEVTMTRSMMVHEEPGAGFEFVGDLERAADAEEGEFDPDRNVEEEMLDIMEIDRALDEMRDDRGNGRKHVFFEGE